MSKFKKVVGKIFGVKKPKAPERDPNLVRLEKEEAARKTAQLAKEKEEEEARKRNLRGARSLLSGGYVGFSDDKKDNLGL